MTVKDVLTNPGTFGFDIFLYGGASKPYHELENMTVLMAGMVDDNTIALLLEDHLQSEFEEVIRKVDYDFR